MDSLLLNLDFDNTELAFRYRSDKELKHLFRLFRLIDSPLLTRIGPPLITRAVKWNLPVEGLIQDTLFKIFCGGDSLQSSIRTLEKLDSFHVKTILDYSVEGEKTEAGFDHTFQELIKSITFGGAQDSVAFIALKISGIGNVELLAKKQQNNLLNEQEEEEYHRIVSRLTQICEAGKQYDIPIFIDAEESWIQGEIDLLAEAMMRRYNQEKAYVYTTLQMYRHDRITYLGKLLDLAQRSLFFAGIKLVRGAYLEQENELAKKQGYPSPIQPTKDATDADFDLALNMCLDHLDYVYLCAGTHNEQSSLYLSHLMAEKGLPTNFAQIWFAQLLGMSDHISFNLSDAGYNVAKYVPYGPVKAVIPYLMRRAQENTAIAGQSSREVELLRKEVRRRKNAASR